MFNQRFFKMIAVMVILVGFATVGSVFALAQLTRDVPSTLKVNVETQEGIALFSDLDATDAITTMTFTADVDQFGKVVMGDIVTVYVRNDTATPFDIGIQDDLTIGSISLISPISTLAPDDVTQLDLEVTLTSTPPSGETNFTLTITATDPDAVGTLQFDLNTLQVNQVGQVVLTLSRVHQGMSGYVITLEFDTELLMIESVDFPPYGLTRFEPGENLISAVDLVRMIEGDVTGVHLATLNIRALKVGEAVMSFASVRIDDDGGFDVPAIGEPHTFNVTL